MEQYRDAFNWLPPYFVREMPGSYTHIGSIVTRMQNLLECVA